MSCDELQPDYLPYALGVLEEPERSEVRAHLDRGCDACSAGIKEARVLAYAMGAAREGPEPPAALRRKILASTGAAKAERRHWITAWAAAATAAAVVFLGIAGYISRQRAAEVRRLEAEISRRGTEAASLHAAIDMLQSPETREVTFGAGKPAPPRGRVFLNPSAGVLLIASNLPAPPEGKTYEMWLIPKSGKPSPAGLFSSAQDGTAIHVYRTPVSLAETGAVAVTLEPAGGVPAPTSQPVIVAAL